MLYGEELEVGMVLENKNGERFVILDVDNCEDDYYTKLTVISKDEFNRLPSNKYNLTKFDMIERLSENKLWSCIIAKDRR